MEANDSDQPELAKALALEAADPGPSSVPEQIG